MHNALTYWNKHILFVLTYDYSIVGCMWLFTKNKSIYIYFEKIDFLGHNLHVFLSCFYNSIL